MFVFFARLGLMILLTAIFIVGIPFQLAYGVLEKVLTQWDKLDAAIDRWEARILYRAEARAHVQSVVDLLAER